MADRIQVFVTNGKNGAKGTVGVDLLRVKAVEHYTEERDEISKLASGLVSLKTQVDVTNVIFLDGHGFELAEPFDKVFNAWREVVLGPEGWSEAEILNALTESEKGRGK
jgi:hypothetical protein